MQKPNPLEISYEIERNTMDAKIVEKAARIRFETIIGTEVTDEVWVAVKNNAELRAMDLALSAVAPEIQAQGIRIAVTNNSLPIETQTEVWFVSEADRIENSGH